MRALAASVLALSFVTSCAPKEAGSCYRPAENLCIAYTPAQGAGGHKMCVGAMTWTPGADSCPPASVGTCTKESGSERLYPGPPNNYTPASARSACEFAKGSFAP